MTLMGVHIGAQIHATVPYIIQLKYTKMKKYLET